MRYASLCSGIEAASVAWEPLGFQPVFFSEIEPFPCAVLAHHYPVVPNYGDMTKFKEWPNESIDLMVGGTPCQSFSVAGLRKGLDDPRGNLMLTYLAITHRYRPRWLVWENVPGVLSSNAGRDFGTFLAGLADIGYGFAYRILDAQHFGVPQRRRRVFVVGHLGNWQRAAAVLFERESLSGHLAPRRKTTKDLAACLTTGTGQRYDAETETLIPVTEHQHGGFKPGIGTLRAAGGSNGGGSETLIVHGRQDPCTSDKAFTLDCQHSGNTNVLCINANIINKTDKSGGNGLGVSNTGYTLTANDRHAVQQGSHVRRLTPTECERLQGFPDGYTQIPYRNKPAENCPDSPRYKAIGNSMAVPVMRWIGERIKQVHEIKD